MYRLGDCLSTEKKNEWQIEKVKSAGRQKESRGSNLANISFVNGLAFCKRTHNSLYKFQMSQLSKKYWDSWANTLILITKRN